METQAVYDGQRSTTDKQRVFILTRSAFLGQQRNAADLMVGRHRSNLRLAAATDSGGTELFDVGSSLLDDRYRRISGRRSQRSRISGGLRSLVRIRNILPDFPHAWRALSQRVVVLRPAGAGNLDRTTTSSDIDCCPTSIRWRGRVTSEGYTPMRALVMDFPVRPQGARRDGSVHVRPGLAGQPGD